MIPNIPPFEPMLPPEPNDSQATELYHSALKQIKHLGPPEFTSPRSSETQLLVKWPRTSRRYYWKLDRWKPSLDRFREAARTGGVVYSTTKGEFATDQQSDAQSVIWLLRVGELFARRLISARRVGWSIELQLDLLRAMRDLQREADWTQMQLAIDAEMHLLRLLRWSLEKRRGTAETMERAVVTAKDTFARPIDRIEILHHEHGLRSQMTATLSDDQQNLRRAVYHCLTDSAGRQVLQFANGKPTIHFPDVLAKRFEIPSAFQPDELVDETLTNEFRSLAEMTKTLDARDTAANATFAYMCLVAHHRRLGFYPENLTTACDHFEIQPPSDPFAKGPTPLSVRLAGGERLRGVGVDNFAGKVRTLSQQPLVYSVGPDQTSDNGAVSWDGRSQGQGDWIFPVPAHRRPRHWLQFDLRKVMIAMAMAAMMLSYLNSGVARQSRAISMINDAGGSVHLTSEGPWQKTLQRWFGENRFGTPYSIELSNCENVSNILTAMSGFDQLESLDIRSCRFEKGDIESIAKFINLKDLYLGGSVLNHMDELQSLSTLKVLTSLDLSSNALNDDGASRLPRLPSVTNLSIDNNEINCESIRGLHNQFPRLTSLTIYNTGCTDKGLENLSELSLLTHLDVDGTKITDAGLIHIAKLDKLETLDMQNTAVTDAGVKHLAKLPKLQSMLLHNTRVDGSFAVHFRKATTLTNLGMDGTLVADANLKAIAEIPKLSSLSIENTRVSLAASTLLSAIQDLSLPDWPQNWLLYQQAVKANAVPGTNANPALGINPIPGTNALPNAIPSEQADVASQAIPIDEKPTTDER